MTSYLVIRRSFGGIVGTADQGRLLLHDASTLEKVVGPGPLPTAKSDAIGPPSSLDRFDIAMVTDGTRMEHLRDPVGNKPRQQGKRLSSVLNVLEFVLVGLVSIGRGVGQLSGQVTEYAI